MRERGKAVEMFNGDDQENYITSYYDLPCKKHPSSSSVGVCAYCLKDRLVNLVCSDCGEQRLSSCSCSEISSNRNSCTVEVGSVGRMSFLIENDNQRNEGNSSSSSSQLQSHSNSTNKPKICSDKTPDDVFMLKRSSSSCVEIKRKKSGFWRIGKLFSKKREKGNCNKNNSFEGCSVGGFEEKSDLWGVDHMGVSRSRSLCSFRGGFFGSEDGTFSGARSSISAARNSGVNGGLLFDPERKSGFSESEPRKSGFGCEKKDTTVLDPVKFDSCFNGASNTRRVFSLREGNFTTMDDPGFIDLKFDFASSDCKSDLPYPVKMGYGGGFLDSNSGFGSMRGGDFLAHEDGMFSNGGSCRVTGGERGIKRSRKSFKSWRWIFRQNLPNTKKKEEDQHDITVSNQTLA